MAGNSFKRALEQKQKSLSKEAKEPQRRAKRALLQRTTYQIKDGKRQTPRALQLLRDRLALLAEREKLERAGEGEGEGEGAYERASESEKRPIKVVSKESY